MTHTTAEDKISKDAELYMKMFTDAQSLIFLFEETSESESLVFCSFCWTFSLQECSRTTFLVSDL